MRRKRTFWTRFCLIFFFVVAALFLWTLETEKEAHYTPGYEREDLTSLVEKINLTEKDYEVLRRQTGLGRVGVNQLYEEEKQEELYYLQERFFEPVEYECHWGNPVCLSERLVTGQGDVGDFMPAVRTGDVLVTFNGHVLGWRSGHAALVVDGERGLILEATGLGCKSRISTVESWRVYPGFALLRLKEDGEAGKKAAAYALEYLTEVPYSLMCFRGDRKDEEGVTATQCAHLVWEAYAHLGYDLDGNGGLVVTPADLYKSDFLEVVQVYGMNY